MPARLQAHFGSAPSRVFYLDDGRSFLVGRDVGCDVVLEDPQVSRQHARILHDETWQVEDLGSKNGLALDGRPLGHGRKAPLGNSCWLGFGDLLVAFEALREGEREAAREGELLRRRTSLQMQQRLDPDEGVEALLERTLRSLVELSAAERGLVFLSDPDQGGTLEVAARFPREMEGEVLEAVGLGGGQGREVRGTSGGAVRRALEQGCPVTLADASMDTHFGGRPSIVGEGIRALLCLPLKVLGRTLGVIYADSRSPGSHFSELDVEILSALASHAALALAVAQMHREVQGVHQALPGHAS